MAKVANPKAWYCRLFKSLAGLIGCIVLVAAYFAVRIYTYGKRTTDSPAQVALVLGAAVWDDAPSPVFQERINHAIALYQAGSVQKILFTGGLGKGKRIAESEAAKQYAIAHGIPESAILSESSSHTTFENLIYARQVAQSHQLESFLIVSDPLHMKRAIAMAKDLGMQVQSSPTPTTRYKTLSSQWGFLMNETYFYLDYRLRHLL